MSFREIAADRRRPLDALGLAERRPDRRSTRQSARTAGMVCVALAWALVLEGACESGSPPTATDRGTSLDAGDDGAARFAIHRPFPKIPIAPGGRTMASPRLVTIVAENDDLAADLQSFSDVLPASPLWAAVSSEYGVGALSSVAHFTGPAMTGSYGLDQLRAYVQSVVTADAGPAPNGNTIYLVYLPASASLTACSGACGCHQNYPSDTDPQGDGIALVRRCTPDEEDDQLGESTNVASHEVVEAATDPAGLGYNFGDVALEPGVSDIWSVLNGGTVELGDPCEGTRTLFPVDGGPPSGWEFQRIWSNAAAARGGDPCIPAAADPYFSVSIPKDWYTVDAGGSVTIPLDGWSVAATAPWFLNGGVDDGIGTIGSSAGSVVFDSQLGVETPASCGPRYAIDNGTTGTLTVTAASDAQPGDFAILHVTNFRVEPAPSCNPLLTEDHFHFWPVGVYVP